MSNPRPTNMAASIEAKLKNVMREKNASYQYLLIRYATERFYYRIGVSEFSNSFVLKGGNLFVIWKQGWGYRPTLDSDMLFFGNSDSQHLVEIFTSFCRMKMEEEDGLLFDSSSIKVVPIREETEYGGTRISLEAHLGAARIPLQFDIGIGDVITPAPEWSEFPVLLNGNKPRIRIYPMATVIAEKTEVMISRGLLNSRMKDFYDVWYLSEHFSHDYSLLVRAMSNTFDRRGVSIPSEIPEAFIERFWDNPEKILQWRSFLRKNRMERAPRELSEVILRIALFLQPILDGDRAYDVWVAGIG